MSLSEKYNQYIETELENTNFELLYESIIDKQVYCPSTLLKILSLTFYHQLSINKTDKLSEITQLENLLSNEELINLRTVPRLLYIITLCCDLYNKSKKPKSYDNLYL